MSFQITDILAHLEENDVCVLDRCDWIFDAHTHHDLYIPIRSVWWILDWIRWHWQRLVSAFSWLKLSRFLIVLITSFNQVNFPNSFRQRDIGLVKYEIKILFLRLFYPTLLVVITVVQLQMFHKKYLEHLELPSTNPRHDSMVSGIQPSSSVNYGSLEPESSPSEEQEQRTKSHYTRINVSDLKNLTTKQVK